MKIIVYIAIKLWPDVGSLSLPDKALDRGLKHGINFPEHVKNMCQEGHRSRRRIPGHSYPTLDPRSSEAEGRGSERAFVLSFGFLFQNQDNFRAIKSALRRLSYYEGTSPQPSTRARRYTVHFQ
ncbi:hypothetical protein K0M31_016164 [Melipona bicolor]|uniref:Uncharacterized protein n=1 Tax=Melipona bicolor TaxID=60889 RepID=A0AA40G6U5_9HYME|nr:hypothetical protein K0M31_016164 [Melipona bicolor]